MISTLALLAGGKATRLEPVSTTIPKSMIIVAGKPFIAHQLELIKKNNISKVVLCISHMGEYIKNYIGGENNFNLKIDFSFDGEKLLGTGGALKKALPLLGDNFFIMYGDSYLDTDFAKINEYFFLKNKKGLMTVFNNEDKWDSSNIEYDDNKIINYNKKFPTKKMKYIDYGLGILNKSAFDDFKNLDKFDLEEVYVNLLQKKQLAGFEIKERFFEIGSFDGLEETNRHLTMNKGN